MAHGMTGRHRRISARKRKSLLSHKGERVAIIIILIARRQPRQLVMVVDGGGGGGAVVQWCSGILPELYSLLDVWHGLEGHTGDEGHTCLTFVFASRFYGSFSLFF